jgi:hypothetical protein
MIQHLAAEVMAGGGLPPSEMDGSMLLAMSSPYAIEVCTAWGAYAELGVPPTGAVTVIGRFISELRYIMFPAVPESA